MCRLMSVLDICYDMFLCCILTEIELGKYMSHLKLSDLFLDPLGHHLLLSLSSRNTETPAELLYLSHKTTKLKQVSLSIEVQHNCRHIAVLSIDIKQFHDGIYACTSLKILYHHLIPHTLYPACLQSCTTFSHLSSPILSAWPFHLFLYIIISLVIFIL